MRLGVRHIEMSRIVSAAPRHIKAVAAALFIGYGDRTPSIRHAPSTGEEKTK
jgi:hypothetical protein